MVEPDENGFSGTLGFPEGGGIALDPAFVFLTLGESFFQPGDGGVRVMSVRVIDGPIPGLEERAADANRSMDSLGRLMTDLIA